MHIIIHELKFLYYHPCRWDDFKHDSGIYTFLGRNNISGEWTCFYFGEALDVQSRLVENQHEGLEEFKKKKCKIKRIAVHYLDKNLIEEIAQEKKRAVKKTSKFTLVGVEKSLIRCYMPEINKRRRISPSPEEKEFREIYMKKYRLNLLLLKYFSRGVSRTK